VTNSIYSVLNATSAAIGTPSVGSPVSNTQSMTHRLSISAASAGLGSPSESDRKSWYEAMAQAWGQALNNQAQVITQLSGEIGNGGSDQPAQITQLTAESMRFSFMATNASTATTSVGEGLESLGRKQ
jgi:hypothetical protein